MFQFDNAMGRAYVNIVVYFSVWQRQAREGMTRALNFVGPHGRRFPIAFIGCQLDETQVAPGHHQQITCMIEGSVLIFLVCP